MKPPAPRSRESESAMETIKSQIDGKQVETERDDLLGAARKAGVDIPTLCHDDRLAPLRRLPALPGGNRKRPKTPGGVLRLPGGGRPDGPDGNRKIRKLRRMILELAPGRILDRAAGELGQEHGLRDRGGLRSNGLAYLWWLCVRYCAEVKKKNVNCFIGQYRCRLPLDFST